MSVLDKICADKRDHVDHKMHQIPLHELEILVEQTPPTRPFIRQLQEFFESGTALITEVKKASPSKGVIRGDFDPVEIATTYQAHGAACLSVLTDEPYFQGHDDYFKAVRQATGIPMLRKDFMIDPYQIYESRMLGADCILLIMACLDDALATDLYTLSTQLGMDVLFEVHDGEELDRAMRLNPTMVGVNNRNLKTLDVDLATGLDLARYIPDDVLKVAESGISTRDNIQRFIEVGYDAFLVGESLMREDDIAAAVKKLL
ncbi:MAG: indole-3-glycerol phosphate synthase TrpC [Alphaproteobacteria bacterium]|nr:indole-3-glycerol phosphate synthase TrpC [Alphaproteobacteria bacterium]